MTKISMTMKATRRMVVLAALAAGAMACSSVDEEPTVSGAAPGAQSLKRGQELVGVWKFVYDGQRKLDVENKLAAEIHDPVALEAAKAEAAREATESEIEFTSDGWFYSRIAGKEIDKKTYVSERVAEDAVRLRMLRDGQNKATEVTLLGGTQGSRRISIFDPQKGALVFEKK